MQRVIGLIAEYQWWIIGVLGLLLLFYLWRALRARREGARSIFQLEQEQARARYGRNVAVSAFILLLMFGVFALNNPLIPQRTKPTPEPTPTVTKGPLVAPTLTTTPAPATITPTTTATLVKPTRPVRPSPTPDEAAATPTPIVRPADCPNPGVRVTSPGVNQVVQGNVAVRGIANIDNFQYFKIEVGSGANPREWTVVGDLHHEPVTGGVLGTFNASAYAPGTYTLRLVVVDQTGNFPEPCRVTVTVTSP
jgi:hypothetical protein